MTPRKSILRENFCVKIYLRGKIMSLYSSEYELKVSFEDLDLMNIVWHGNYMRYLEQARCDMFSKLGYTYMDMKDDGFVYPVAKMSVKYIKPAQFMDILLVKSEIISIEPSLDIKYKIFNKITNEKIFEGSTMQICYDLHKKQSVYSAPECLSKSIDEASHA